MRHISIFFVHKFQMGAGFVDAAAVNPYHVRHKHKWGVSNEKTPTNWRAGERGVGHFGLILAVVVVLALGGVGYLVFTKNKNGGGSATLDSTVAEAIKNAKCEYDDKELCKFFTGFKAQKFYTVNYTSTDADGKKSSSTIQWSDKKSHMKPDMGDGNIWETITIDNTVYQRATDGTWWKSVNKPGNTASPTVDDYTPEYKDDGDAQTIVSQYKQIGKEACGNLTCFKYQEMGPSAPGTTHYFWFDDKDYQLRRDRTEADGTVTESTYSYAKFTISEPSPVKELGPNQYLVPGQSQPQTIPSASEATSLTQDQIDGLTGQYSQ